MPSDRLTKSLVDATQPKASGDLFVWDAGKGSTAGFGLKVAPTGRKTFVFQYRLKGGKMDRRIKIGKYGDWTVETARDRARELRRLVDSGHDPFEKRAAEIKAREEAKRLEVDHSFGNVAAQFLEAYKVERLSSTGRKRSPKTIEMVEGAIKHLSAHFGRKRIDTLTARDIRAALAAIPAENVAKRRNVYASASILWSWALENEYATDRIFEALKPPAKPRSRDRVLSDTELAVIWRASRKIPYPFGPVYRLLILSGQRREEVAGMDWREMDRAAKTWTLPPDRAKNAAAHIVPLSDAVIAEIDAIAGGEDWPTQGLVFVTPKGTPLTAYSAAKRRLDAAVQGIVKDQAIDDLLPWRVHDLRRTVATGLQRLGVRLEVTESVLNHTSGTRGGIVGVYQRHDWANEKRDALNAWADHVLSLARPKSVACPADAKGDCNVQ
jgi:integrase